MNKIEFSILITVTDGNPNGNPDGLNLPRQDAETGQGLMSDVKTKRLIRNFLTLTKEGAPGYDIQIAEGAILNELQEAAYKELGIEGETSKEATAKGKAKMCEKYFDARTFGAVMSTGDKQETAEESEEAQAEAQIKAKNGKKEKKPKGTVANCGQVRGPVQIMFGRSIDRITPEEHLISRCAATNAKDADLNGKNQTFGRKATVPFALFRINGFINPFLADKTGFTDADLEVLWEAILNAWEFNRSANSGQVDVRALYVWEHASKLGSAPAHKTLETLSIKRREGVDVARSWYDYEVTLSAPPKGVMVREIVEGEPVVLPFAA
jgi:CRISPR-associated protein Csd2